MGSYPSTTYNSVQIFHGLWSWGRTDMAPFKFARAIQTGKPLDVYNKGNLWRDFTYIDDIVTGINLLASTSLNQSDREVGDSLSKIAPLGL